MAQLMKSLKGNGADVYTDEVVGYCYHTYGHQVKVYVQAYLGCKLK